jgi:serine O-acetyltransferase
MDAKATDGWDVAIMSDEIDNDERKVSAEVANWNREKPRRFWDPGRKLMRAIRRYQYWNDRGGPFAALMRNWAALRFRFWTVVTGADIPLNCKIGGGLHIPHPNGIVIHPGVKIGVNCLIFQQVTIGTRDTPGVPVIEGHVDIGAGAKILGPINIGPHAKVGANAVVLSDVPAGAVAVGNPAKIIGAPSATPLASRNSA